MKMVEKLLSINMQVFSLLRVLRNSKELTYIYLANNDLIPGSIVKLGKEKSVFIGSGRLLGRTHRRVLGFRVGTTALPVRQIPNESCLDRKGIREYGLAWRMGSWR